MPNQKLDLHTFSVRSQFNNDFLWCCWATGWRWKLCKGRLKTNEKEKRRCVRQQRENERQGRGESMYVKFKDWQVTEESCWYDGEKQWWWNSWPTRSDSRLWGLWIIVHGDNDSNKKVRWSSWRFSLIEKIRNAYIRRTETNRDKVGEVRLTGCWQIGWDGGRWSTLATPKGIFIFIILLLLC